MTQNDRIILDEVLKQRKDEIEPDASDSDFFEMFCAEQILKDHDLSYDELESGLVGSGRDGGVDGIYTFVNDELVQEEGDFSNLKRNITLDLVLLQAKTTASFQETPVERFLTFSEDIFDLSKETSSFSTTYNDPLLRAIERFRLAHQQLAAKFPKLRVNFIYASKGSKPDPNTERKVEKLRKAVERHFPDAEFVFEFLGAPNLLGLARTAPQTTHPLALAESPITSAGKLGFVCLVKLRDYYEFISDETGQLRRQIFEANVRDYQGRTSVNDDIQESLKSSGADDFWWLNNGVSILATKASLGAKTLTIEDPQIVNGLQTSTEVYTYFSESNTDGDDRNILVRVIVPSEGKSRDRIIKATNSQTVVQQASLRATEKIHRDIEEFMRPRGLFYDRRKNFYKNEGKPRDKVIGIPHMAQSVMAIVLGKPDTARARPSSLLKKDEDYKKIFNTKYRIELFYVCAEVMRRVEAFLKSPTANLDARDRNNLRFYVGMHLIHSILGSGARNPAKVAELDLSEIGDVAIQQSLVVVKDIYEGLGGDDAVAKGSDFPKEVQALAGVGSPNDAQQ